MYINDPPDPMDSNIYLFADDTKVTRTINTKENSQALQKDLDSMHVWTETWLLKFHPNKCTHMTKGHLKPDLSKNYFLPDKNNAKTIISKVNKEKDIGVTIDSNLKFNEHIAEKLNKANKIIKLIRRTFTYLDPETFTKLYKAKLSTSSFGIC